MSAELDMDLAALEQEEDTVEEFNLEPALGELICEEAPEKWRSPIHAPSTAKGRVDRVRVLAVSKGKLLQDGKIFPMPYKVGDILWHGSHYGSDIEVKGRKVRILRLEEIRAREL